MVRAIEELATVDSVKALALDVPADMDTERFREKAIELLQQNQSQGLWEWAKNLRRQTTERLNLKGTNGKAAHIALMLRAEALITARLTSMSSYSDFLRNLNVKQLRLKGQHDEAFQATLLMETKNRNAKLTALKALAQEHQSIVKSDQAAHKSSSRVSSVAVTDPDRTSARQKIMRNKIETKEQKYVKANEDSTSAPSLKKLRLTARAAMQVSPRAPRSSSTKRK